jgi:hypothetical protein
MTQPTYSIAVDWDNSDWAGTHDFTTSGDDITAVVKAFRIARGKDKDSNSYPAATLELTIENSSGNYYPTNSGGTPGPKVRIWLPVRVQATYSDTTYDLFYGYINRITAYPIKNKQEIYFYCTDGIDLLAKQIVVQDMDHKTTINDGEAVNQVLNAADWRTADVACTMQNTGDTVTKNGHGLSNADKVMFNGASIPAALDEYTTYYVVNKTDNTFQVETSVGGGAVVFAGDGSGNYHKILRRSVDVDGGDITSFPDTFEFEA